MKKKDVIFITGSTGLIGGYLLRSLVRHKHDRIKKIIALSRGKSQHDAGKRVLKTLQHIVSEEEGRKILPLIEVVKGDLTNEYFGLPCTEYNNLIKEVTVIYHSAALCKFKIPWNTIREINVTGVKNILDFGMACQSNNHFKGIHHLSTIAIGGNTKGVLYEDDLNIGQTFNNTYEQSKFEGENLVGEYRNKNLPITVYRPAIVVGDTTTGYTNNFRMFYQILRFLFLELFKEIPANGQTRYSFCPVDYVSEAIAYISTTCGADNNTYHITNPNKITLSNSIKIASEYFNFTPPALVEIENFNRKKLRRLHHSFIQPYIPYLNYKLEFDNSRTSEVLKKIDFQWPKIDNSFLTNIFRYCIQCGFIRPK